MKDSEKIKEIICKTFNIKPEHIIKFNRCYHGYWQVRSGGCTWACRIESPKLVAEILSWCRMREIARSKKILFEKTTNGWSEIHVWAEGSFDENKITKRDRLWIKDDNT